MLELHYSPGNASLTPHLLLEELGAAFTLKLVDRTQGAHKTPAYLALNPNGLIPVLVDARFEPPLVLYETAAICLHLLDTHPGHTLAPAVGTPERAHFYKRLVWLTNTVQASLIHYFYPERIVDAGNVVAAAQVKSQTEAKVGGLLDQMDAELAAHGQPWLKISGLAAGVAHGVSQFRKSKNLGDATTAAREAARQRETDLHDELRNAGRTPMETEQPTPQPRPEAQSKPDPWSQPAPVLKPARAPVLPDEPTAA